MFGIIFHFGEIDNQLPIGTVMSFLSDSLVSIKTLVRALITRLNHGFDKIRLSVEKSRINNEMTK